MSAKKGETVIHGSHCPRDMAVRMREVLARPWFGVCVPLALSLLYFHGNFALMQSHLFQSICQLILGCCNSLQFRNKLNSASRIGKIIARWHLTISITSHNELLLTKPQGLG